MSVSIIWLRSLSCLCERQDYSDSWTVSWGEYLLRAFSFWSFKIANAGDDKMLWILQPGEHSFQTVTFFREVRPTRRSNGSQKPSFMLHVDMALVVEQKIRVCSLWRSWSQFGELYQGAAFQERGADHWPLFPWLNFTDKWQLLRTWKKLLQLLRTWEWRHDDTETLFVFTVYFLLLMFI